MVSRGRSVFRRRGGAAGQQAQQPVREIVQIVQPLAPIWVGLTHRPGALIALYLLDGCLRGKAGGDRFMQPLHPALVVGEHAVGFQHFAVLAGARHVAVGQHDVDRLAQLGQRACRDGLARH